VHHGALGYEFLNFQAARQGRRVNDSC
jgi:hypothetical protein